MEKINVSNIAEKLKSVKNSLDLHSEINFTTADKSLHIDSAVNLTAELIEKTESFNNEIIFITKQVEALNKYGFADWRSIEGVLSKFSAPEKKEVTKKSKKKLEREEISFPPYVYPKLESPARQIKVATILDKFSESAFGYEWDNKPLSLENWEAELDGCQLLFVESAWAGNSGDWAYCLTGETAPRKSVIDLTAKAREKGIPSIFWNKEDPPHFSDFLETAALFDVVLTTDSACVARYKELLGHENVGTLPFAAQPKIHNPIRPGKIKRDKDVAFGGMYFAHKFPERRAQMEYLLPAANKFNFDIFSRQLDGDENYQFPKPYHANVVGSLSYESMLSAYHAYSVFLNVNSVTSSSTMCARRVFEIIASGAAVVSAPSPAIANYFPNGLVPMPDDEKSTYQEIRALLQPGGYREKLVHKAQRLIWQNHTFGHRVDEILKWAKLPNTSRAKSVSVIAPTIRPEYIPNILRSVARQNYKDIELNLLLHGFDVQTNEVTAMANDLGIEHFNLLRADSTSSLGSNLNRLVDASTGEIVTKMDDDDFYGPDYVSDLINAKMFSNAEVVGKAAAYVHFESKNATILSYGASEHRFTDFVRGATLTADRELFLEIPFKDLRTGEDSNFLRSVQSAGGKIYASDRFNFWIRRSAQSGHHTWTVADRELFSTGPVVSYGDPTDFVGA